MHMQNNKSVSKKLLFETKETIVLTVRTTFCNFFANITCFLSNFRFEPQVTYLEVPTVATRDVVTPH